MNLKNQVLRLIAIAAVGLVSLSAQASEKPSGPNGGRILKTEPRAEFLVNADRKIQITFLDQANQAVAPAAQVVTVTAGERSAPVTMKFAKSGNAFVSDVPLPAGNDVPAVVQIKASATAKTSIERFNVDLSKCPDCKKAEYACVCH
jgi:hypothetical protein